MATALVILGAVVRTLAIQGVGVQQQTSVARSQSQVRQAIRVLADELSEIAATDGDLVRAEEHSLTIRTMRKVGVVCDASRAGLSTIDVWVLGDEFSDREGAEDSLLVFLHHDIELSSDDEWLVARLEHEEDVAGGHGACAAWTKHRLTGPEDGEYPVQRLRVERGADISGVAPGSPVRSFEYISYALQEVDGTWALTRRSGPDGSPVVLVDDLAPANASGLTFAYVDTDGNDLTTRQAEADPASIGSIAITVTARQAAPSLAFQTEGYHQEALSTAVYLRNNHVPQVDPAEPGAVVDGGGDPGGEDDEVDPGDAGGGDDDGSDDDGWVDDDGGGWEGGGNDGGDDTGGSDDSGDDAERDDPETRDDCRRGGWEDYGFENQRQCIRFVTTGEDSRDGGT